MGVSDASWLGRLPVYLWLCLHLWSHDLCMPVQARTVAFFRTLLCMRLFVKEANSVRNNQNDIAAPVAVILHLRISSFFDEY